MHENTWWVKLALKLRGHYTSFEKQLTVQNICTGKRYFEAHICMVGYIPGKGKESPAIVQCSVVYNDEKLIFLLAKNDA